MSLRKTLIRLVVIAGGAGILLLSLFAFQLGLDNDPGWGPRRLQILGAGIAVILFGALYWITPVVSRWLGSSPPGRSTREASLTGGARRAEQSGRSSRSVALWLLLFACLALWSYVWIMTIGTMAKWPEGRNYYGMLAEAFRHGQTSLLAEPPAELLKLENPYDLEQRRGLDYLWDTSLYQGKYYLYWGPVPAVLGAVFTLATGQPVNDAGLVLLFAAGTVLFSILLLGRLLRDNQIPSWVFWGGVLACAINMPLIWLFTHPAYYEASIAGGQFFMMAGFFVLYLAFRDTKIHPVYLLLSALSFGLAGGTRVNLLPSVVYLALLMLLYVYMAHGRTLRASARLFAVVLLPLGIIAISLMLYNHSRFGSVFEFGHRYQLTGLATTSEYGDQVSTGYILPSLYSYVIRPPALNAEFPFVTVPAIKENMWPFFINPPENYYYAEPVAGILLIVPLIGLSVLLVLRLIWLLLNGDVSPGQVRSAGTYMSIWLGAALLGYALIQTALLFVFVSSSMRYLFDVTPAVLVLSCMYAGAHTRSFEESGFWRKAIPVAWSLAAVLTALMGFLVGFTGAQNNFLNKNPQLYSQILEWFSR